MLARRMAENGYAVLAIDVNGHGQNRNPFNGDEVASGTVCATISRPRLIFFATARWSMDRESS